jgi:predicted transcriptional regulator
MRTETIQYFTEKEEEFVNLLIAIGTKRTVAKLLVFLANVPKATSRTIERGTDMRQPEVSLAMKDLMDRGWVKIQDDAPGHKGRPSKIYELALPMPKIMDRIEKEKSKEAKDQLALVKKMRSYVG